MKQKKYKTLEELTERTVVSFVDKILYFPCVSQRERVEFPAYLMMHQEKIKRRTLYIAVKDKSYAEYMGNVYRGLTGKKTSFSKLKPFEQKWLNKLYEDNKFVIESKQRDYR